MREGIRMSDDINFSDMTIDQRVNSECSGGMTQSQQDQLFAYKHSKE